MPRQPATMNPAPFDTRECFIMVTVQKSATRHVAGGQMVVRRPDAETPWEISLFRRDRFVNDHTGQLLQTAELAPRYYESKTFATPDDAAEFIRQLLAA